MRNFSKFLLFSLIASLVLVLAACSGGDSEEDTNNNSEGETESNQSEGEGEGEETASKSEQVLNVNIKEEPPSLHPGLASDTTSSSVLDQVFEGLTRINPQGEAEEAMAEDIQVSDDQKLTRSQFVKVLHGRMVTL